MKPIIGALMLFSMLSVLLIGAFGKDGIIMSILILIVGLVFGVSATLVFGG